MGIHCLKEYRQIVEEANKGFAPGGAERSATPNETVCKAHCNGREGNIE